MWCNRRDVALTDAVIRGSDRTYSVLGYYALLTGKELPTFWNRVLSVKLTNQFHLMMKLRKGGAIPPLPHMTSCRAKGQLYFTRVSVRYLAEYVSHREMFRTKVLDKDIHTMAGVCTISQNPGATSKSSVPEGVMKQSTYQGLRKISRQHTKLSCASNMAPGICAPFALRPTQMSCVSLALLGATERDDVPSAKLEKCADWFCSQFMLRVLAQIKNRTSITLKGALRSQQRGGPHVPGRPTQWTGN